MTLAVGVRLTADGKQLVGQLNEVKRAEQGLSKEARALAEATRAADAATESLAQGQVRAKNATEQHNAAVRAGSISEAEYRRRILETKTALGQLEKEHRDAIGGVRALQQAQNGYTKGSRAATAATANLGFQIQDITQGLAMGVNPMVVFGQQAGQTASAISMMGGTAGRVGTFLAGPWGSLILAGTTVLGMMLLRTKETETATIALGEGLDLTSMSARDMADALADLVAAQEKTIRSSYETERAAFVEAQGHRQAALEARKRAIAVLEVARANAEQLKNSPEGLRGNRVTADLQVGYLQNELIRLNGAVADADKLVRQTAVPLLNREAEAAVDGVAAATLRYDKALAQLVERQQSGAITGQQYQAQREALIRTRERETEAARESTRTSDRETKAREREAKALDKLADTSASKILQVNQQFADQPKLIRRAMVATTQLDEVIADLTERKPPNFEQLIADAKAAKEVVADSLQRPFRDMVQQAERQQAVQSLILAGRDAEAEALRRIYQLQDQVGAVTREQREWILDNVEAERAQNEAIAERQQQLAAYRSSLQGVRGDLENLLAGGDAGDFLSSLKRSFAQLKGKVLTEQIFGDALRDLDNYVKEQTGIRSSVDIMREGVEDAGGAAHTLADALTGAAGRITGAGAGGATPAAAAADPRAAFAASFASFLTSSKVEVTDPGTQEGLDEIVVVAKRNADGVGGLDPNQFFRRMIGDLLDPALSALDDLLGTRFFAGLQNVLAGALEGYVTAGPVGGVLGALKEIKGLPESISKGLNNAFAGAQQGYQIAQVGKALGLGGSSTGGAIGGAIGGVAGSFIPGVGTALGSAIGGVLGSALGGLFGGNKTARANITGADSISTAGADSGNYGTANDLAGQVVGGLANIVDALGGELGSFNTTIGVRGGDFRVNRNGTSLKLKNGADNFGEDSAAAIAAAIADAIADGAIQGISPAVEKALKSSSDLQAALAEAVAVNELEQLLGGGSVNKFKAAFAELAKLESERVRLAKTYGLDMLAVEELNMRERNALRARLEQESFGSLQDLLQRMRSGDLFEGSAVDQRQALLAEIEAARADAEAGVEGATDKLAALLENLNSVSQDVYGTTGGYAGDRSSIESTAEAVISTLRAQLDEAQSDFSAPQLDTANALMEENNDQNARMIAALERLGITAPTSGSTVASFDLAALAFTGRTFF